MEFRLLGPLEVTADGRLVELHSLRQQVVLAMLLFDANHVVPLGRLVDALWDDAPPVTARSQVQTCISALRRQQASLGARHLIATRSSGYLICIPDTALDITNFWRLVNLGRGTADTRPEDTVRQLRAALSLWRGPAAAGIESRVIQDIAIRLNEDYLTVLVECIDLELSLGKQHELIGELSELVRKYPLRERIRAQHMLALYRSKRQAEALESFQEARRVFLDELGLEPGQELGELQSAILTRDRRLELSSERKQKFSWDKNGPAILPYQLPPAIADFTGRDSAVEAISGLLSAADAESAEVRYLPVVSLIGKGGVGKTALALHVAHLVRDAYPDGQLFAQLKEANGDPIGSQDLLGRFLRALGLVRALPTSLAERANTYRSLLDNRRVLIVLDDADGVSQVTPLIPGSPGCAVIITSRNTLSGLHGAHRFEIDDLDEESSIELLRRVIGAERVQAEESAALDLVRLCGYLPLALRIAGARLIDRPHWNVSELVRRMAAEGKRLDELVLGDVGIRATLSLSYRNLKPAIRQLLVRLSLLGSSDFASWVSAPLLDVSAGAASDLLDALVDARLVDVRTGPDGLPRFHLHDLIRIYALERLAADESAEDRSDALQRLLRCWLSLAREAHRRVYGGDFAVLHGSAPPWGLPPEATDRLLDKPLTWFRSERDGLVSAILKAAQAGLDEICWDLAVTSVTLFELDYQVDDWQKTHHAALEVTRRAGNIRGEAAVLYSLGILATQVRMDEAAHYLTQALSMFDMLGDIHGHSLTLGAIAFVNRLGGHYEQAFACYEKAVAEAREAGDQICEVDALTNMAQIQMDRGEYAVVEELVGQALIVCRSLKARRSAAQTEHRLGEFLLRTGDLERAERSFAFVLQSAREDGDLLGEAYALHGLGVVHTKQRRYVLADADLAAAVELTSNMGHNLVHGRVLLAYAELCLAMAEPNRAAAALSEAAAVFVEIGPASVWYDRFLELKARVADEAGGNAAAIAPGRRAIAWAGDPGSAAAHDPVQSRHGNISGEPGGSHPR